MMTVSKGMKAGQAETYFEKEKGYYDASNDETAKIKGKLAETLGISNIDGNLLHSALVKLNVADIQKFMSNKDDNLISELNNMIKKKERITGFDIQFAVPKESSILSAILFANQDHESLEKFRNAFVQAVDSTMEKIQEMIGYRETTEKETSFVRGNNIIYNQISHELNRAGEVHEHVHNFIYNLVQTEDGKFKAYENEILFKNQDFLHNFFHASLGYEYTKLGLDIEVTDSKKGTFKILGVPENLVKSQSMRTLMIEAAFDEFKQKNGRDPNNKEREVIKLKNRPPKDKTLSAAVAKFDTAEIAKKDYSFGYKEALGLFKGNFKSTIIEKLNELDFHRPIEPQLEKIGIIFNTNKTEIASIEDSFVEKYLEQLKLDIGEYKMPLQQFYGKDLIGLSSANKLAKMMSDKILENTEYSGDYLAGIFRSMKIPILSFSAANKEIEIGNIPQSIRDKYAELSGLNIKDLYLAAAIDGKNRKLTKEDKLAIRTSFAIMIDNHIKDDAKAIMSKFGGTEERKTDVESIKQAISNEVVVLKEKNDKFLNDEKLESFSSLPLALLNEKIAIAGEAITERSVVFDKEELFSNVLKLTAGQGRIVHPKDIENAIDNYSDFVRFQDGTMTTKKLYDVECFIQDSLYITKNKFNPLVEEKQINKIFKDLDNKKISLRDGQKRALAGILSSKDMVYGIQGHAGTGKTFSVTLLPKILGDKVEIIGLAPTVKAANILSADIPNAQTMKSFLSKKINPTSKNRIYVIDEMSMVSSELFADVFKKILVNDPTARVVVMGDKGQYASPGQGKVFADMQIYKMVDFAEVDEIVRQKDELLKESVSALVYKKDAFRSLDLLAKGKHIIEEVDVDKRLDLIVDKTLEWGVNDTIVGSSLNREVRLLNSKFHDRMKLEGNITSGITADLMVQQSFEGVNKFIGNSYEVGMKVIKNFNYNSAFYTITDVHENSKFITISDGMESSVIDLEKDAATWTVFKADSIELSINEPIMFGRKNNELNINTGTMGRIIGINNEKNEISIEIDRFENGKKDLKKEVVKISLDKFPFISHAYASTPNKLQGATGKNVVMNLHAQITTSEAYYVSLTRAVDKFFAVTNNMEVLKVNVSRKTDKTSSYGRKRDLLHGVTHNIVQNKYDEKISKQDGINLQRKVPADEMEYLLKLGSTMLNKSEAIFTEEQLIAQVLKMGYSQKLTLDPLEISNAIKRSENIVSFGKKDEKQITQLSGKAFFDMEKNILNALKNGLGSMKATLDLNTFKKELQLLKEELAKEGIEKDGKPIELTKGQENAMQMMLTTEDKYAVIQGRAGAGKTFMIEKARHLADKFDLEFVGQSFMGSAADELEKASGIKSSTIDSFLLSPVKMPHPLKQTAYVIDEAGMIDAHLFNKLITRAERENARVFFIGDKDQFPAVGPSALFEESQKILTVVSVDEIKRQRENTVAQAIVRQLAFNPDRKEAITNTISLMEKNNMIQKIDIPKDVSALEKRDATVDDMVKKYIAGDNKIVTSSSINTIAPQSVTWRDTMMIASTNDVRRELNQKAHSELIKRGELEKGVEFETLREWRLTEIDRKFASNYKIGLYVAAGTPNFFSKGSKIGERAVITALDNKNNLIQVERDGGERQWISLLNKSEKTTVTEKATLEMSVGEPIIFKKNQGTALKNGQKGIIEAIDNNKKTLKVRLASGDITNISINNLKKDYAFLELGHALTDYNSQGKTTDSVMIYAASQNMNFNAFYTELTRTKEGIKLWSDNIEKLMKNIAEENNKSSTLGKTQISKEIEKTALLPQKEEFQVKANINNKVETIARKETLAQVKAEPKKSSEKSNQDKNTAIEEKRKEIEAIKNKQNKGFSK
jgi:conjugative relaxase-like TrwC/TraI family protein